MYYNYELATWLQLVLLSETGTGYFPGDFGPRDGSGTVTGSDHRDRIPEEKKYVDKKAKSWPINNPLMNIGDWQVHPGKSKIYKGKSLKPKQINMKATANKQTSIPVFFFIIKAWRMCE